uniref:Complement factor properdin n=1 Tax=Hucho hucho TaxID=62062 RepID=A0A4W5N9A2_9TELE
PPPLTVDGQWSSWTPWGQCSTKCNGGWGEWSNWTDCTKSCGGGVQSRRRDCDSPSPEGEGDYCEGLGTEVISFHGSWSLWSGWSECDGCEGVSVRTRECNSPPARFGGLPCHGESRQSRGCQDNVTICSVDGSWSQWGGWSECSAPCGGGVKLRMRQCDNPAPQSGGRGCAGMSEQQRECNSHTCTGTRWDRLGEQSRTRVCSFPPCSGMRRQSKTGCQHGLWNCSLEPCPVDGGLSTWGPWSPCSLSCGGLGLKTRNRACSHPAPAYGGRDCLGPRQESTYCQAMDCPGLQPAPVSW